MIPTKTMAKTAKTSSKTALCLIRKKPTGGFLMLINHPTDKNIIGWINYNSVAEEISDRMLDSINDAVGERKDTSNVKMICTFQEPFSLVEYKGKMFIDSTVNPIVNYAFADEDQA